MSDFFDFYGANEIDFSVKSTNSRIGGLNFQFVPINIKNGCAEDDFQLSISIDEIAFSTVENIF